MAKISIIVLLIELHTQIGLIGGTQVLTILPDGSPALMFIQHLFYIIGNIDEYVLSYLASLETSTQILAGAPMFIQDYVYLQYMGTLEEGINIEEYPFLYVIKNILLISSLLSLIIGTVVGLAQIRIKRLFAYSTISHIGFMLLALAINTEQSIDSLIFYLIQYTITNLNAFLILIAFSYMIVTNIKQPSILSVYHLNNNNNKLSKLIDIKYILDLKGQFISNPILSLSLTISLFSMAGTPPLIGFFSKQFVLYSAVQSGYYFMAVIAIIVSVISASYYLKIIKILYTETELENKQELSRSNFISNINDIKNTNSNLNSNLNNESLLLEKVDNKINHLTNYHSYLISILTLTILLFVLKPSLILNSTQLLSLSLFNF